MFFDELGDERVSLSAAYILITVRVFGGNTTARLLQLACMNAHTHALKALHRHDCFFLFYFYLSLSLSASHTVAQLDSCMLLRVQCGEEDGRMTSKKTPLCLSVGGPCNQSAPTRI